MQRTFSSPQNPSTLSDHFLWGNLPSHERVYVTTWHSPPLPTHANIACIHPHIDRTLFIHNSPVTTTFLSNCIMSRSVLSFLFCCVKPSHPPPSSTPNHTSTSIPNHSAMQPNHPPPHQQEQDVLSPPDDIFFPPFHIALPGGSISSITESEDTDTDAGMGEDPDIETDSEHESPEDNDMQMDERIPEDSPRYTSWVAMVRGVESPQPVDSNGVVHGYAPPPTPNTTSRSFFRRIPPSLTPSPFPLPFELPPPAPIPFPTPSRPSLRAPPSISASTSGSVSISVSRTPPPNHTTIWHLPNEVLDIIIKNLSSRPRSPEPLWDNAADTCNSMAFATTCTRFLNLFCARLVAIRTRPERYREDLLYTPPTAGVVINARTPSDVAHLSSVLRLAGPTLRELLVTKSLPRTTWVDSYASAVSNLRKLSLRDVNSEYPLEKILQTSSRTLKELEIVGATGMALSESQLHAMSIFCSSVNSLALRLSMFDHDWTNVWMGIGPGLTKLSLGATRFWIMDTEEDLLLQQIGRYCVDLKNLHFYHLGPTLGTACARLCSRYGNQLENLELEQSQMLRGDIEQLARGCPTTRVSVSHGSSLFSHAYNVDVIDLLGGQIETLRYRSQLAHDESLWEVGRRCSNLRELRLDCASTLSEASLESILRGTGAKLRSLSMSFFVRGVERALASSALGVLATVAAELRELHIGGQRFDLEAFGEVMRRCRGSLRKVSVTFGFRTAGEREIMVDMLVGVVQSCWVCKGLESLVIVDRTSSESRGESSELRQAVWKLRGWVNRVSICGIDYIR